MKWAAPLALLGLVSIAILASDSKEPSEAPPPPPPPPPGAHGPPWNPPAPGKPLKQSEVTPAMTAWAIELQASTQPMHSVHARGFADVPILARVEWHTVQASTGKTGIFRAVSLYHPIVAAAAQQALRDATARWPNRNRASDGILPSAEHMARSPNSDHNTGLAFDLTHDPASGAEGNMIAQLAILDPRTRIVIWSGQKWDAANPAAGWQARNLGAADHTSHVHVSILPAFRDDVSPWPWATNDGATT